VEEKDALAASHSLLPMGSQSLASKYHHYGSLSASVVDHSTTLEEGMDTYDSDNEVYFNHSSHHMDNKGVSTEEVVDEVSIIANTINALLGVSLFAMPWGFQQSGVVSGVVILIIVAVLSYDTSRMLLVCQKYFYMRTGEVKGYPEIAASALGPHWHTIVQTTTIVSCLGGCTGYIIFFGDTVGQILSLHPSTVIVAATIPLVLLSWIRTFRDLTIFTVFGVVALVATVMVILYDGSQKVGGSLADTSMVKWDTSINYLGQVTFLFTIHYTTLAMGAETLKLKSWMSKHVDDEHSETSYSVLTTPIAWSFGFSAVLVAVVGISGFVMYQDVGFVR
jgi:amino acid permease